MTHRYRVKCANGSYEIRDTTWGADTNIATFRNWRQAIVAANALNASPWGSPRTNQATK